MVSLNQLPKTTARKKKRLGRGYGSGKGGHTVGRGSKGQKARGKVKIWFEGGQLPLVRRLPFKRGKGRFKSLKKKPIILNLKYLNLMPPKSKVNLNTVIKHGLVKAVDANRFGVKILGSGKINHPLTVALPVSNQAKEKIEKAGGKVIEKKG